MDGRGRSHRKALFILVIETGETLLVITSEPTCPHWSMPPPPQVTMGRLRHKPRKTNVEIQIKLKKKKKSPVNWEV